MQTMKQARKAYRNQHSTSETTHVPAGKDPLTGEAVTLRIQQRVFTGPGLRAWLRKAVSVHQAPKDSKLFQLLRV